MLTLNWWFLAYNSIKSGLKHEEFYFILFHFILFNFALVTISFLDKLQDLVTYLARDYPVGKRYLVINISAQQKNTK